MILNTKSGIVVENNRLLVDLVYFFHANDVIFHIVIMLSKWSMKTEGCFGKILMSFSAFYWIVAQIYRSDIAKIGYFLALDDVIIVKNIDEKFI